MAHRQRSRHRPKRLPGKIVIPPRRLMLRLLPLLFLFVIPEGELLLLLPLYLPFHPGTNAASALDLYKKLPKN